MAEQLFDRTEEYEAMLNAGIELSGERQDFFIEGRVSDLRAQLAVKPRRILDFGCGTGKTSVYLNKTFPGSYIVGADLSERAVAHAQQRYGSPRTTFVSITDLPKLELFDLCYVNGVFHHIQPEDRQQTLKLIRSCLSPSAQLAIFENNPWNPGARLVMHRIPFDRNAIPLSFLEMRRRMKAAGFEVHCTRSLFYFPKMLAGLRFAERSLARLPLGAQYYVLASVPIG